MTLRAFIMLLSLVAVVGCTKGAAVTTEVNGFRHKVEAIDRDPPSYRAYGATSKDRAQLTNAYYARNVIAIRNVAGCPVKPELISHEAGGPTSTATVIC